MLERQRQYYQCNRGEILRKQGERDRVKLAAKAADPLSSGAPPTLPPVPSGSAAGFSPPTMVPLQRAAIPGNLAAVDDFELRARTVPHSANGLFVPAASAAPSVSGHANCAPHSVVKL